MPTRHLHCSPDGDWPFQGNLYVRCLPLSLALWHGLHVTAHAAPPPVQPVQARQPGAPMHRLLPMEAVVNGAKAGSWLFLERYGLLYAPHDAFEEWRVPLAPDVRTVEFRGQLYSPLTAVPGYRARADLSTLTVDIQFSPEAFAAMHVRGEALTRREPAPVLPAVFLNYDINAAGNRYRGTSSTTDLGLLTELGFSTGLGVLTVSHAGRNLADDGALGEGRQWTRLETTFTRDFPQRNLTLRLGDTATRPGLNGRTVYFGGLQLGSNFALTPGFVRQPLPRLHGVSATPSTVEMYVNDVLRRVSNVPTGPFTLDGFPVLSGAGEVRLVVRDALGRETVIVQPFLTSAHLLAPGLSDWSVEAGRLREGLGTVSNAYGTGFGALNWARGFTESLTLEWHAQASRAASSLGMGAVAALPFQALGRLGVTASRSQESGHGQAWLLGMEPQGLRHALSLEARGASRAFRQLGMEADVPAQRLQTAANWSYSSDQGFSLGLGYARIEAFNSPRVETVSANLGLRVLSRGQLAVTASHALTGSTGPAAGVTLTLPIGAQHVVGTAVQQRGRYTDVQASVLQNPAPAQDIGWRLLAGRQQGDERLEGGLYAQGARGVLSLDASLSPDQQALRAGLKGGWWRQMGMSS